jgi:hypothetical protein
MFAHGNRIIQSASPEIFVHSSYPSRVRHEGELWRYADAMQDRRARTYFDALGGLTEHEFGLWKRATAQAAATTKTLGRRLVPVNGPLAAIRSYRLLKTVFPSGRVFEVGPGSGYLGHMLMGDGFAYGATDVTQAFCLWCELFWGMRPIPWWEWFDLKRNDFPVDIIVANHTLNEMEEDALRYLIVRAERMLGQTGVLVAQNLGAQWGRQDQQTLDLFHWRGWKIYGEEGGRDWFLSPPQSTMPPEVPFKEETTKTWTDVEAVWRELGAETHPDDAFQMFLETGKR